MEMSTLLPPGYWPGTSEGAPALGEWMQVAHIAQDAEHRLLFCLVVHFDGSTDVYMFELASAWRVLMSDWAAPS